MNQILSQVQKIIEMCGDNTEIVICNKNGIIEYCSCQYYTQLPSLLLGKHILDVYPSLNEQTSTLMRALKTGESILNEKQILTNSINQQITLISTTIPIYEKGEIIGAADYSRYLQVVDSTSVEVEKGGLYELDDIITNNEKMISVKDQIKKVSDSDSTVLIYGDTGTGKELVAQSIHTSSKRKDKPFVSQNCAAIPNNLFESIFFGTEKGSFTGAQTKEGLFEYADGGTLFLDEINSMDISMQVKLLKVLEDKTVRRVGGYKDIPFDVRIICATNENLEDLVASKQFREDLYYRISIVKIKIPPLRQRREDVFLLADYFIKVYNKIMNKNISGLSEMAKSIFYSWKWPGNVRELKNVIESAFNFADGDKILLKDIQVLTRAIEYKSSNANYDLYENNSDNHNGIINLQDAVNEYERELILKAINSTNSLTSAANKLSITPQSLNYKISKFNLR